MVSPLVNIPQARLADFCRRNHIRKLSLFGSALRDNLTPQSDIDLLVEFRSGHAIGFLEVARMERELSEMLGGRKIDLRTAEDLSRYFRREVVASAAVQYAEE